MKNHVGTAVLVLAWLTGCSSPQTAETPVAADPAPVPVSAAAPQVDSALEPKAPDGQDPQAVPVRSDGFKIPARPEVLLSGLKMEVVTPGDGPLPLPGQTVAVNYAGWLEDGTRFDSSKKGRPLKFPLGKGRVIDGWDEGIARLKVGGKAYLVVPPLLGYGEAGSPPEIPPNASLIFLVELVGVE